MSELRKEFSVTLGQSKSIHDFLNKVIAISEGEKRFEASGFVSGANDTDSLTGEPVVCKGTISKSSRFEYGLVSSQGNLFFPITEFCKRSRLDGLAEIDRIKQDRILRTGVLVTSNDTYLHIEMLFAWITSLNITVYSMDISENISKSRLVESEYNLLRGQLYR